MPEWTFSPYNLEEWNSSEKRILFVAAEPNEDTKYTGKRDMGEWFRTAHALNKPFYTRCKIMLDGICNCNNKLNHFRFIDLKAESGSSKSAEDKVKTYVNNHAAHILKFFVSNDKTLGLKPHIAVILGNNTYNVFSAYLKPKLIDEHSQMQWICMPHPSATIPYEALRHASAEINKRLVSINERPSKWFFKDKGDFGWKVL